MYISASGKQGLLMHPFLLSLLWPHLVTLPVFSNSVQLQEAKSTIVPQSLPPLTCIDAITMHIFSLHFLPLWSDIHCCTISIAHPLSFTLMMIAYIHSLSQQSIWVSFGHTISQKSPFRTPKFISWEYKFQTHD